jgi:hypothetical protein
MQLEKSSEELWNGWFSVGSGHGVADCCVRAVAATETSFE